MSTSGSFVPASVPECPYEPRMTRAAALALASAGGLKENCVVVLITDTPVIGTAGNTSVTEIELNPVSPTAFGQTARVFTTFAPEAWPGVYDIANNSITELRDDFGNVAKDVDATAPTVHTQFPWHLGSATLRDNYVEDSTLTGWDTQTGSLINNHVIGSTVNLTGKTAGTIQDTTFQTASVILGAGGGTVNMARSHVSGITIAGTPLINHTGTGTFTYNDVIHRDGVTIAHSSPATLNFFNATIENHNFAAATVDINHASSAAAAQLSIGDSVITGPGNGAAPWIDNQAAAGNLIIQRSELNGARITRTAGSTGPISINQAKIVDVNINEGAANGATTNSFNNADLNGSTFNLNGPVAGGGRNDYTAGLKANGLVVNVAATATAGISLQGGTVDGGTLNQNRTAGTGSTTLFSSHLRGFTVVTDNGTVDPGSAGGTANTGLSLNRLTLVDTAVTLGNVTGKSGSGTILQQVDALGSTLTITGPNGSGLNDFIDKLRVHAALFVNGGFRVQNGIVDGVDITMTADQVPFNSPKLANAAFTNWV